MKRLLYVVGEPGVGKSTFTACLLDDLGLKVGPYVKLLGLLSGHPLVGPPGSALNSGMYLGRRRAQFPGTDALSMGVQPDAVAWLSQAPSLPDLIVGEGQRLGNVGFLDAGLSRVDSTVIHLVGEDVAALRREARGTGQNEGWVRASRTRAANFAAAAEHKLGLPVVTVSADSDLDRQVALVRREVGV